tara:strand:+ start:804 stop:1394 length:591 start_codon:yes stop_codon:yes gene_type:complete
MKVKITSDQPKDDGRINVAVKDTISVNIVNSNLRKESISLNMRQALNGDYMIFDHNEIDIVVMTEKKKVVAFAKDVMSNVVYGAESRLMEHLRKVGIIEFDSIQGGNVYGSLEGKIHNSKELDEIKTTIYQISEWMKSEAPYLEATSGHDEEMQDELLHPDALNSTELGEVPHEEEKGSIKQHNLFAPYLYGRYTY